MGGIQLFKDKLRDDGLGLLLKLNIVISTIFLGVSFMTLGKTLFISESEGLSFDASKRDFCSVLTKQIIDKKLSKSIITESLYELVTKDNYKDLYFEGDEKVSAVWSGEESCKVLVKTNTGLRSFDYFLEKDSKNKFYYKVKKITENELFEKENS